jgi:hypothetical protein
MGFKISARVGERFFKHFVFQIHFSKTKPVQAKFESQKWRQENVENVPSDPVLPNDPVAINCQTILSQSIAKRSCQNKLSRENVGTKNVFSSLNNATRFCAPIGIAPLNYGGLKAKSGGQFPNIIKLAKLAWQQNLILF